jgi:hypothetical protein
MDAVFLSLQNMKSLKYKAVLILFFSGFFSAHAQSQPFQTGEVIKYEIHYHWKAVWVDAGEVSFSILDTIYKDKDYYHFYSFGRSLKKWDWFYKVRDTYEAISDKNTLKPIVFSRSVREGSDAIDEKYLFNFKKNEVYTVIKKHKTPLQIDTVKIKSQTYDPLSMIYYARCIDFSKYKANDSIPINLMIDNSSYTTYIRYLGKETIKSRNYGEVNTIKFSALLLEGSIFKGGENMLVWVTDDNNKIPVEIESEIRVGSIQASLLSYKGLKFKSELTKTKK